MLRIEIVKSEDYKESVFPKTSHKLGLFNYKNDSVYTLFMVTIPFWH